MSSSWWDGDDISSGGGGGLSMWRSEWGNMRSLQDQIDAQAAAAASSASVQRRLSSQLSQLQGDLSQRVDRLAKAFDAFVELSQLRDQLVLHTDARRWRVAARRLVEGSIAHAVLPAGGATVPDGDVPDYWLVPAVRGLPDLIERGADGGRLDEAARRDPVRTATFVVAVAPLLGAPALASRWIAGAVAADGPATVTNAERAIWLAATDGRLPAGSTDEIARALAERLAAAPAERVTAAVAATPPAPASSIAPAGEAGAAGPIERWAAAVEAIATAPDRPDSDDLATDDALLRVVRSLVEEGSVEERPLLDRAEQLGAVVDPAMAGTVPHWDDPAGELADLLVADAGDAAHPARARLAVRLLRDPLLAAADHMVAVASAAPPDSAEARLGGRMVRVTVDGADPADVAAARTALPSVKRVGPPVLIGAGLVVVLSIVLAVIAAPGWLTLGLIAVVVVGALWLTDRTASTRAAQAARAEEDHARGVVTARVAELTRAREAAQRTAERARQARAQLAAGLDAFAGGPPPAR